MKFYQKKEVQVTIQFYSAKDIILENDLFKTFACLK